MFDAFLTQIAAAYAALPGGTPACFHIEQCWRALAQDSVDRAAGIRLLLRVVETDDPEPYVDAFAMCEHIEHGGFYVSRAHSEHPVWTVAENVAFRIVHDVLGHYAASAALAVPGDTATVTNAAGRVVGFDWAGENAACAAHGRLLTEEGARVALFTECIAQTGYAIEAGGFGEQKIGDVRPGLEDALFTSNAKVGDLLDVYAAWCRGDIPSPV